MAVHGTDRGQSVSWDHEGLLQLLSGLARERTGLPVLRCYWYEATVDGRRTAEQDAQADVPGIKLRVAKIRPGRREGVDTEIHRDLTTLARNNAISDAVVVSAEEDLAQVIADVQDLGMRVTLVHIAVDGNWTIARALRQESDDIIQIGADQLRPYVELIAAAEPPHAGEAGEGHAAARPLANGHSTAPAASYQVPAAPADHAPTPIYAAPVVAEYQRPAPQQPRKAREAQDQREEQSREDRGRDETAREDITREDRAREDKGREDSAPEDRPRDQRAAPPAVNGEARPDLPGRPDGYAAPVPGARSRPDRQEPAPQNPAARARVVEEVPGHSPGSPGAPEAASPAPAEPPPGQLRRLPSSRNPAGPGPMGASGAAAMPGQHHSPGGSARGPYSGPQPVMSPAPPPGGYQQDGGGVSLSEAMQAAHEEGQEFGGSVARDAPALWLEAVLARKPRMPSDLEARLLQGSALPIDFLLHDEVRHALRRGFWDALERTRR